MNEENRLPRGWVWTRVGEIYDIVGGGTPSTSIEEYWKGDIAWITSADIYGLKDIQPRKQITKAAIENSATNLVPEGSLIVVTRVGLGKVALTNMPLCFSQDSQALIGDSNSIYPDYSLYYLAQAVRVFKYQNRGTTIAGVTKKQLSELPFVLPPLPEQQRIVAAIEQQFSRLDAGVAALRRAQAKLKRYRAAILKAAVEGKLTEDWRAEHPATEPASELLEHLLAERRAKWEADLRAKGKDPAKVRYVEPAKPDTENLPGLPEGWCWATFDQCFEIHIGATPSRKEPEYWRGDMPWVSSGEVQFCRIRSTREHITQSGLNNSSTQINPIGSVLLGMIGEGRTRGQVAILDIEACNNQNCAAIWVSRTTIVSEYIYYWLWSQYEVTRQGSSGNNQPALNKSRIEQMTFPLLPIAEQEQLVAEVERRLSVISQLEATVEANLKRAERLRQSILREAFAGRLVSQNPDDEPASVLLGRIRGDHEKRKHGTANKGRVVNGAVGEPVKIDVKETRQVELWESVGG